MISIKVHKSSSFPIAAQFYLWFVIRELPPASELLYSLVQRLQDLLEIRIPAWWSAGSERITWLL